MSKLHPIAKKHGYKSNEDFYKDFPDEQSYKMAMGGESGAPHNGQPDYKEFFNYGYIPSGPKFFYQDGGQPDAQEFYDYGYIPSGPEFFYQKGGNIPKAYSDAGMKLSNDEVLSFARNMMAMGELSRDVKSPSEMYKVYDTLTPNDRERVMLLIKSPEGMNLFQDDRYMRQHNFSPFNPYNVPQQIRQHNERNRVYQDGGSNTNKYSTTDDKSFLNQFKPKMKTSGATKYDGQSQDEYLNGIKESFVNSLSNNAQMAFHKEAMGAALNPQQESNPYEDESQEYAQDGGQSSLKTAKIDKDALYDEGLDQAYIDEMYGNREYKYDDIYGNPITTDVINDSNLDRTYYDPRENTAHLGNDYNNSRNKEKVLAHENRHAWQFNNNRSNFDIAHNTDYADYARMLKKPSQLATDDEYYKYHNRKIKEVDSDIQGVRDAYQGSNFIPDEILYNQADLDNYQYSNPVSMEGEAQMYEDYGIDSLTEFQQGGSTKRNSWGYLMDAFNRQPGWSYPGQSQGRPGMINTQGGYDTKYTGSDLKNIDFSNVDPRGVKININKRGVLNTLAPKRFAPKRFSVSFGDYNGPQDNSNPSPYGTSTPFIPRDISGNQPHNPMMDNPRVPLRNPTAMEQGARKGYNPNETDLIYKEKGGSLPYAQVGIQVNGISFPGAGLGYGFAETEKDGNNMTQSDKRNLALSGASANQPQNQTILNSDQTVQSNMAMSGNMDNKGWTPNASTAAGRFDFKRKNNMTGETKANLALAGTAGLGNLLGMDEQMAAEEAAAVKTGADQQFYANNQYNRGTWADGAQGPNINFRPNQQTPVQFTGQAPTEYNTWSGKYGGQPCYECGGSYKQDGGEQYGGEVYMSEDEIQQFLADGGQLEFLD